MESAPRPLERLTDPQRVAQLLHPLRQLVLREARVPSSASEIARRLEMPRQRVNHHVRALAEAGLLLPAGTRKRRGAVEHRYTASADAYVLGSEVLGPVGPGAGAAQGPSQLFAAASQCQEELAQVLEEAPAGSAPTLTVEASLRFPDAAARSAFARELEQVVAGLLSRHATPLQEGEGDAFRMLIGVWPRP